MQASDQQASDQQAADIDLLYRSVSGDRAAFGMVVERYQGMVCGIAYAIIGDFPRSEDIGQEAFVAAWKQLGTLRDLSKFRSWLGSITRNLAVAFVRRQHPSQSLDAGAGVASGEGSPEEQVVSREEQAMVWAALEGLPENYRQPLVLFYREDQSVGQVAEALAITPAAAKQRLSRGREMMRQEVQAMVERALKVSAPGAAFTLAVLGALPGGASTLTATAGMVGAKSTPVFAAAAKSAMGGAIAGTLGGLFGGLLGSWFSWKNARYQSERQLIQRAASFYLVFIGLFSIPFIAMSCGWDPIQQLGARGYLIAYMIWMGVGFTINFSWMIWVIVRWRAIVKDAVESGDRPLPTAPQIQSRAYSFTSKWRPLGLPILDVQLAAADPYQQHGSAAAEKDPVRRLACGWIAVGSYAVGVVALGNVAVGVLACGTFAVGILAFGAIVLGGAAVGGVACGGIAFGGLTFGVLALGGLAIGWWAIGGLAIGWLAAKGGVAIAGSFAVGGHAEAPHANDPAANQFFQQDWIVSAETWMMRLANLHSDYPLLVGGGVAIVVLICVFVGRAIRNQQQQPTEPQSAEP